MWLLKQSFYKVFCGGEDLNEVRGTMDKLRKRGVQSVLDYAVEASPDDVAAMSAETFEENLRLTWDAVKAVSDERDGLVAVKVTALGPTSTMERAGIVTAAVERLFAELCGVPVSAGHRRTLPDLLISKELTKETFVKGIQQLQTEKSMPVAPEGELNRIFNRLLEQPGGGDDKTKVSFYQWCHLLQPHMVGRADLSVFKELIPPLSDEDVKEVEATEERLFRLCEMTEKVETKPSLLVDAEHSPLQGFIRAVTINAQKKFNKNGKSLVYNTYQAYLKETKSQLTSDLEMARRFGVTFALKLVRGAYMSFERRTAEENGYPSPVHDCLEDTHNSYDACVRLLLSNIDRVALFMGSHNAESLQKATALLYEICEERNSGVGKDGKPGAGASTDLLTPASLPVSFGQLLGMGDHLTFTLSDSGFRVYKYVPYGPVDVTIPYLLRRAQENAGMMGGAGRELFFVAEEVKNRVKGWLGRKEQTSDSGQYATRR
ncbi:proline dehydrogenase [Besnoitia besnoiti]|uniref:Proline dehydrogenase n=1 Tax=Besnoitia besnoiti TaxID=94643 RepID=A0A2A9MAV4_BESBE|nr:proline dehydrogenase [Besnoitia besnoiti]PFH32813.1 proline dehydrogenase [Besnoitia besnoiti]